jgi:hypothetical protein
MARKISLRPMLNFLKGKLSMASTESSFEMTQEMLTFSLQCLLANLEAWNAFLACRNPGDPAGASGGIRYKNDRSVC